MSSSAINAQLFQAKIGSIQNQADSTSVYSAGVWSFKNSTAVTSVTIDNSGNVGIGTSSPATTLQAQKNLVSGTTYPIYVDNGAGGAGTNLVGIGFSNAGNLKSSITAAVYGNDYLAFNVGGSGTTERMRIDASGRLLIAATGPLSPSGNDNTARLQVTGHITSTAGYVTRAGSGGASANLFNIYWTGSAQLWIDTTNVGTITLTSDYRIKKNVETQELPALERIAQLRPVKYEYTDYKELYKADGVQREGFIAHELQAVIPSAVEGEKDAEGQIQSLKLDALCSVMVKAIQEQQAQIEALKAEVAALKAP